MSFTAYAIMAYTGQEQAGFTRYDEIISRNAQSGSRHLDDDIAVKREVVRRTPTAPVECAAANMRPNVDGK